MPAAALTAIHPPTDNHLLALLPADPFERLRPHLQPVPLPLGWSVYESGDQMRHVFFPTEGIVSLLSVMEDGSSAEIALTGCEGLVGISLFMGGESTPNRAVVQSACDAYRLSAVYLKEQFALGGSVHLQLLKFTQALITQISQTAVCNRHHSVEQQLCRWLLLSLDRLPGNEITMTQELIANMLGVRRQGVTAAARDLESDGLNRYKRGAITVLDRPGLEARSCECYGVVRREYDRLLGHHSAVSRPAS
jgi:CRP-like cAMP-binding protein